MRSLAIALFALIAASSPDPAKAQNYPWCAIYSGDLGGATSCAFVTLEQCRATVSGVSGYCVQNPSAGDAAPRRGRRP